MFTRIWMALFGLWSWDDLPALPPELILLPARRPAQHLRLRLLGAADDRGADGGRGATGPSRPLPFAIDELRTGARRRRRARPRSRPGAAGSSCSTACCHAYERQPPRRCAGSRWRAPSAGSSSARSPTARWGGIQPPWVYSIMALHLLGYPLDHPLMRDGAGRARRLHGRRGRPLLARGLPVAGLGHRARGDRAARRRRARRRSPRSCAPPTGCSTRRSACRGDWAVRRPRLAPGGWAFEFANDNYPDIDDTAEVVIALRARRPSRTARGVEAAIRRGVDWIVGMQSSDDGWGAFDVDNTSALIARAPVLRLRRGHRPAERGRHRARGRDARRARASAGRAPPARGLDVAAARAGGRRLLVRPLGRELRLRHRRRAARRWWRAASAATIRACGARSTGCEAHQNADGGWGEDCRSYVDRAWIGRGESTASQTAWALLGLHAAGRSATTRRVRARRALAGRRPSAPTASWDEPQFTGTGFPGDFYINYHLYRLVFPVMALGRCARGGAA